jgi:DNA repair protein RadC
VLAEHAGLAGLARCEAHELLRCRGLGPAKAASVLASLEMGRRVAGRRLQEGAPIRDPADVFRHFHPRLRDAQQERFLVLLLDGRRAEIRRRAPRTAR